MSGPELYRKQIEEILHTADLDTITTKKVRLELEQRIGQSLTPIKQEINGIIEETFLNLNNPNESTDQQDIIQRKEDFVVNHKNTDEKKSVKKATTKKQSAKPTKKSTPEKRKRAMPFVRILPPLSHIVKTEYCSRTQAVSKMWEYIREHKLQDENNKRNIGCDAYFKEMCDGLDRIDMFSISKYIQKYMEKLSDDEQERFNPKKDDSEQPPVKKVKKAPRDMPILKILPPLSNIINAEYCSRTQTVSKVWEYIREHKLQNPKDKRLIDCDDNFKELCDGLSQISSFAFNKYTQKCFVKISEEEQLIIKKKLYGNQPQENDLGDDDEE